MLGWLQLDLGPIRKDADRNFASDGGPDTSIALIWSRLVKNPCLGWISGTMDQGPGPWTNGPGTGDQDQDQGPRTMGPNWPGTKPDWDQAGP